MSRLAFATGGTGGHVYPALAVAEKLQARGHEVHLIGQAGGMEERLAAEAGLPFEGVRAGKLDRQRPDPRALLGSLRGVLEAKAALRRVDPGLVVGFGGFAALPGCTAAKLLGIPLVLHEQNAFPGLVTRALAPVAERVVVSQPEAAARLRSQRITMLPYPVRETRLPRVAARRALGLPEQGILTLVMGGSQGSAALNEAVPRALKAMRDLRPLVLHSTGPAHIEGVRAAAGGLSNYFARPYVDATLAWSAADLAITRAGTGTLSEAALHGVPLIMVPLPSAAENHQLHNALAVEAAGAGICLEQRSLESLADRWREMLDDERRQAAARAAAARSPAGAAERFAVLLDGLLAPPEAAEALQETR